MRTLITALLVCLPGLSHAQGVEYATADGRVYVYAGSEFDGVIYAEDDVADVYTLNFDCSVTHDKFGTGEWHWANGGWVIEYDGAVKLGFPRQEAPMDAPDCAF